MTIKALKHIHLLLCLDVAERLERLEDLRAERREYEHLKYQNEDEVWEESSDTVYQSIVSRMNKAYDAYSIAKDALDEFECKEW